MKHTRDRLADLALGSVHLGGITGGTCAKCDAPHEDGAAFCMSCGERIQQNECPKCNAYMAEDAKFCLKCGTGRGTIAQTDAKRVADGGPTPPENVPEGAAAGLARVAAGGEFWSDLEVDLMIVGVDKLMAAGGQPPTDADDRDRLVKEMVPWLNRKFPMQGESAADIRFYWAVGLLVIPRTMAMLVAWWNGQEEKKKPQPTRLETPAVQP